MLGRAQEDVGVIELAADLLRDQSSLADCFQRAQRARLPKRGVPRPMRELKGLRQRFDLVPQRDPLAWRGDSDSLCLGLIAVHERLCTTP